MPISGLLVTGAGCKQHICSKNMHQSVKDPTNFRENPLPLRQACVNAGCLKNLTARRFFRQETRVVCVMPISAC